VNDLIRSFVAVEVPDAARAQVCELLSRLGPVPGVRWVKPDAMHLTLAFLGEVTQNFIRSAEQALAPVAASAQCFDARLSGLGAFPSAHRARVFWVGMDQGRDELCRLQASIVQALVPVGFVPESRKFSPHLTLGRLKVPADVSSPAGVRFTGTAFAVDRVILFRSELRPEGPRYTRLAEFALAPSA
jgi:2'-5' RNA ligase